MTSGQDEVTTGQVFTPSACLNKSKGNWSRTGDQWSRDDHWSAVLDRQQSFYSPTHVLLVSKMQKSEEARQSDACDAAAESWARE